MRIEPSKSRRLFISQERLTDRKFVVDEEEISSIREKSVKVWVGGLVRT